MLVNIHLFGLVIDSFTLLIALAVVCFIIVSFVVFVKLEKIELNKLKKLVIIGAVGIAALAVFSVLFNSLFHTIEEGELTIEGITWEGGLIGALPVTVYILYKYCPEFKERPLYYLSLFIPALVIAHGVGRIGCFCAGCCFGKVTDSVFGISFPAGSDAALTYPGGPNGGSLPVYPTQLFEAVFEILFCIVSFILYKKYRGHLVEIYAIAYGIFRFLIEYLRGDDRGTTGMFLSPSQLMSIVLIVGGILVILYHKGVVFKNLHKKIDDRLASFQDETSEGKLSSMPKGQTIAIFLLICGALFFDFVDITYSSNEIINRMVDSFMPLIFGSAAVGVLVYSDEKNIFLFDKKWLKYLYFIPCLIVAIDNFPFISYFAGNSLLKEGLKAGEYITFTIYAISVGAFEELLFRGVLYKIIAEDFSKDKKGFIKTYVVTSVVFGCAHLLNLLSGAGFGPTIMQVGYSILIGGLCAFALIKTRNIIFCILTHGIYDFCGLILTEEALGLGVVFDTGTTICMAIISVIIGVFVLASIFTTKDDEIKDFYNYIGIKVE